jgi:hypothetical protein
MVSVVRVWMRYALPGQNIRIDSDIDSAGEQLQTERSDQQLVVALKVGELGDGDYESRIEIAG